MEIVKTHFQSGDLVVCFAEQRAGSSHKLLSEVLQSDSKWNVEAEIKKLRQPILIIHGENDEAVPVEHGEHKYEWVKDSNKKASLKIISGATHTFNTKHPFEETSPQLEEMIDEIVGFIKST